MAKQDPKRPEVLPAPEQDPASRVPEIRGGAGTLLASSGRLRPAERPVPELYPALDTDLARDNLENDLTAADRQDL